METVAYGAQICKVQLLQGEMEYRYRKGYPTIWLRVSLVQQKKTDHKELQLA